jgi:Zn-finger nucleic acid-binding protein
MRGLCPRCESETLVLGNSIIEAVNKKQVRVSLRQCPKCRLVFYEAA